MIQKTSLIPIKYFKMATNNYFKKITEEIVEDPLNRDYVLKGFLPVFQVSENSKILIVGQAPGLKAQTKGVLFKDKSGDNLRQWLDVTEKEFYNDELFAVLPIDFFYPGKAKTGDLPPRKEFAEKWHKKILQQLKNVKLTILIGTYANKFYLKDKMEKNLTLTVKNYQNYLPTYFPIVHPSPLNFRWHNKNPWFKKEVIKDLQKLVKKIINV